MIKLNTSQIIDAVPSHLADKFTLGEVEELYSAMIDATVRINGGGGDGRPAIWVNSEELALVLSGTPDLKLEAMPDEGMRNARYQNGSLHYDAPLYAAPQPQQAAPGAVLEGLLQRAEDLHEKSGMPWAEAEKLALSEAGIEDRHIDEISGNTDHAIICSLLSKEEVREFTRTILIYGQPLLSAAPKPQGE